MDLNTIALWLGALPAFSLFLRSARGPHRPLGWMLITGLVLLASATGWLLFRDYAGYLTAGLSLFFVILPTWASNVAGRANHRFLYRRARRFFTVAAIFHPLDGWPAMPRLFEAFELAHQGKLSDADALLRVLAEGKGQAASVASAQRLRFLGRWSELKAFAERAGLLELRRDAALIALYLRALGELGETEALAEFMLAQESILTGTGTLQPAFLYLFAFTGHVELTRRVLRAARHSAETEQFWLAVAAKSSADLNRPRIAVARLKHSEDEWIRGRTESHDDRLTHVEPTPSPSPRTLGIVTHFARLFAEREQLVPTDRRSTRHLTLVLIFVNTVVYLVGSYPYLIDTRAEFGERWAFFAPDVLAGQWWRALSYLFVHANWIHLVMNMVGLWALGPFVERAFGRARFAVVYLVAGCSGSAVYLTLNALGWIEAQPLVGASGCIMGLLGATAAVMLRAWIRQRASIARQIFLRLLAVVALQVMFDLSTPQVAGLAHALGLLGGFCAGLLLKEGLSPARSVASLA